MKTKKIFKQNIEILRQKTRNMLINKYFNIFLGSYQWKGISSIQADYIMRKFWSDGTVAAFPIRHTNEIGFTTYATQRYNMYDFPEEVMLINKWNVPFMPQTPQQVNKDVVVGWIQSNHKPIWMIVEYYIDRMVQVDMVINTNLQTSKMPFVIGVTPADVGKAQDILDRILNDEVGVFMDADELQLVKSLATATPYIIDKLYTYKTSLENELLTFLGIDNALSDDTKDRLIVDQVNANNAIININQSGVLENLKAFTDQINENFNVQVSVIPTVKPVTSVHEEGGNEDVR